MDTIDADPVDDTDYSYSEGSDEILFKNDDVELVGSIVDPKGVDDVEPKNIGVVSKNNEIVKRNVWRGVSVAVAFGFLAGPACEKKREFKPIFGPQAEDAGPLHRLKEAFRLESEDKTHKSNQQEASNTKPAVVDGEKRTETKGSPSPTTPNSSTPETQVSPKTYSEPTYKQPDSEQTPNTTPDQEPKTTPNNTTERADSIPQTTEPLKTNEKTETNAGDERSKEPVVANPDHTKESVENKKDDIEIVESTPMSHEGPGRKIAEYIDDIVPSGDLKDGYLNLCERTAVAKAKGFLVYNPEHHCFSLAVTKDVVKQGIPAESFVYYEFHQGNTPRPPIKGASYGDFAETTIDAHGKKHVDLKSFDDKKYIEALRKSIKEDDYIDEKGVFDKKSYEHDVIAQIDLGKSSKEAFMKFIKTKDNKAKEDLYNQHVVPYMGRLGTTKSK